TRRRGVPSPRRCARPPRSTGGRAVDGSRPSPTWRTVSPRWSRSSRSARSRGSRWTRLRSSRPGRAAVHAAVLVPGEHDALDVEARLVEGDLLDERLDVARASRAPPAAEPGG